MGTFFSPHFEGASAQQERQGCQGDSQQEHEATPAYLSRSGLSVDPIVIPHSGWAFSPWKDTGKYSQRCASLMP